MVEIVAQVRKWGRSLGVIIPKEAREKANLKEGKKVKIIIQENTNPIRATFGILKMKRPTEQILKEVDEESWDE